MPNDVFGEYYLDGDELAFFLAQTLKKLPLKKFDVAKRNRGQGITVQVNNPDNIYANGVYVIFEKKYNNVKCLYVGKCEGNNTIYTRLYRWGIEMCGIQKSYDQNHPAAYKARKDGIKSSRNLYVTYMTWNEIDNIMPKIEKRYKRAILDEKVASILNAKYNERGV